MVHYKKFENGIRLVVNKMSSLMSVTMGILVHTGACVESDSEDGISHFIEHMMFKGTKKRTSYQISDEMDRIGAQMNAFTGKDMTCYYAKSTTGHAAEAFDILADLFLESTFSRDEMEKDKGVIVEEINMNEDTPDDLCLDLLSRAFYGERGYGRNILGPAKNVKSFDNAAIAAYMDKHYVPDNIVISMAGNIDEKKAEDLVSKYFSGLKSRCCKRDAIAVDLKGNSIFKTKKIEQVHIGIAYPSVRRYEELYDATQVMNTVLGGGISSRLFQRVREDLGLAYSVYSFVSSYAEAGSLSVYAGVNSDKYLQSVKAIYDCIDDLKKNGMKEEEFLRGKEQLISSSIFSQESTGSQMLLVGKEMLYSGNIYDFEKRINEITSVTLSDVRNAIDYNFDDKFKACALVGAIEKPL